ncbi:hypothetical protein GCM10027579_24860 [Calidifontibacter terrae]
MSTLWPGLGLIRTRRRAWGIVLAVAALLVALLMTYLLLNGGIVRGAASFTTHKGIRFLIGLFVLGGIAWVSGIVVTARESMGRRWPNNFKWILRAFTAVMVVLVAVPAAQATRYVFITQRTLDKIYSQRYDKRGGSATTPVAGANPWKSVDRVNILLLGADSGAGRWELRTDSVMVVSIDPQTGDSNLVSIPRNLEHVPFPENNPLHAVYPKGFSCANNQCLMDAIWVEAEVNKRSLFPKDEAHPGLDTTREVVSEITGLSMDYTVVVDLAGFNQMVDAMGGVYMNVPGPPPGIPIGGKIENGRIKPGSITGYIKPGYQKLNGYQALWYSRSRVAGSDNDRMRRQRCMVSALISQSDPISFVTKFTQIMSVAENNITMDIPQDDLPAFANLANRMKKGNLRTVNVSDNVNHYNPDYAKIRSIVKAALAKPHDEAAPKPGSTASSTASSSTTGTAGSSSPSSTSTFNPITNTADSC